jgi:hypothetical protein
MPDQRFSAETVVAEAVAADPAVIDRLAAFNPVFTKLRNPVLRKTMARLVTFRDAATLAGVAIDDLLLAVNGGEGGIPVVLPPSGPRSPDEPPSWVAGAESTATTRLDVRQMLAAGGEPLGEIMRAAARVEPGKAMILDAPFDPAPLRRVLGNKGFAAHPVELAADHWRVYFRREASVPAQAPAPSGPRQWREQGGLHIDVRGLEPPQPMVSILRLLETSPSDTVVTVHHEREPLMLYPELAERGWTHAIVPGDPGEVRLVLRRAAR